MYHEAGEHQARRHQRPRNQRRLDEQQDGRGDQRQPEADARLHHGPECYDEKGKGEFASDLYKCTLDNTILRDANLTRANLSRSSIQNADLSSTRHAGKAAALKKAASA